MKISNRKYYCSIPSCFRMEVFKGMCRSHYNKDKEQRSPKCTIEGCGVGQKAKGLCSKHLQRQASGASAEDMRIVGNLATERKRGWIHKGYRWVMTDDHKEVMEHRHLMEQHLGRKLHIDEVVHHRNENKIDNRIENLEVMARDQHTREHQLERIPCRICYIVDPKGCKGFCAKHYQADRDFQAKYGDMYSDPMQSLPEQE